MTKRKIRPLSLITLCTLMPLFALVAACSSAPTGTYTDTMGAVILELRSGGNARFTFSGDVLDCNYTSSKTTLTLTCKGDTSPTVFTIHDDGSLTGPPGTFMPPLRKQK